MERVTLAERCRAVDLLILDVDGVLTSGQITYATSAGEMEEIKAFHVRDGSGLKLWHRAGKQSAIITGRASPLVRLRAAELGIVTVIQGAADKAAALNQVLTATKISPTAICYVGDDVPDVAPMSRVGLPVAVADACPEARRQARYTTRTLGGLGAVREVIELILRCQGNWPGTE